MDRTGLLIIRAWIEDGSPEPLRAQIRLGADVTAGFERTLTLADPDEICAVVEEWLDGILGDTRSPG
ncbi:MAG: hypothetical protein M3066_18990 [Actinomycetota bacterium]|nr:hypothetical protein [Actinomycetota bacterium]